MALDRGNQPVDFQLIDVCGLTHPARRSEIPAAAWCQRRATMALPAARARDRRRVGDTLSAQSIVIAGPACPSSSDYG
jgi:hypothetical protein